MLLSFGSRRFFGFTASSELLTFAPPKNDTDASSFEEMPACALMVGFQPTPSAPVCVFIVYQPPTLSHTVPTVLKILKILKILYNGSQFYLLYPHLLDHLDRLDHDD